jgi:hypothetical protein
MVARGEGRRQMFPSTEVDITKQSPKESDI